MKLPAKFGEYYLFERIAVGGMAEVFKAASYGVEAFERLVAVKRVLPSISEDQEFIDMFIDEAKIAVQLSHANIGQVFELGNADGRYFIAMEFVSGKDTRAVFDRSRTLGSKLDIAMCCHIVKEVCEALEYAHTKKNDRGEPLNLIHRDVSPQNILVSYEGEVKLIDFGIAKAAGKANKTQSGILKGKFGYMSPEQVRGKPIDRRSDLFSLGTVLYELLTGERCFQGPDDFSILEKVRKVDFRRPTLLNRMIPPELERIIYRSLTRNPDDRFQTAAAFKDELQKFLYQSGSFYSRKELSDYMHETFDRELSEAQERTQEFRAYARENILAARRPRSLVGDEKGGEKQPNTTDGDGFGVVDRSTEEDPPSHIIGQSSGTPRQNLKGRTAGADISSQMKTIPLGTNAPPVRTEEPTRRLVWLAIITILAVVAGLFAIVYAVEFFVPSRVHLTTKPATVSVFLDGQFRYEGQTPVELKGVAPGEHWLVVKAPEHRSIRQKLELDRGRELRLDLKLTPSKPKTELIIETTPGGATVYIDGKRIDESPVRTDKIPAGNRQLRVEKAGFLPWSGTVEIKAHIANRWPVSLFPEKVAIKFISEPERAQISVIDSGGIIRKVKVGQERSLTIANRGDTRITATAPGYRPLTKIIPKLYDEQHTEFLSLERAKPLSVTPNKTRVRPRKAIVPPRRQPTRRGSPSLKPPMKPQPTTSSLPPVSAIRVVQGTVDKPGFLKLLAKPPAIASVNGKRLGWTPILRHSLNAGRHAILLIRETEPQYRKSMIVEIKPGQTSFIRHVHESTKR